MKYKKTNFEATNYPILGSTQASKKWLRSVGALLVLGAAFQAADSHACSIYINRTRMSNDLTAEALSHLDITIDKVSSAATSNFGFNVLNENPSTHCPATIQYDMDIQVNFRPNRVSNCSVTLHVTKVEHWSDTTPPALPEYTVTGDASQVCRPLIIRPIDPIIRPLPPR